MLFIHVSYTKQRARRDDTSPSAAPIIRSKPDDEDRTGRTTQWRAARTARHLRFALYVCLPHLAFSRADERRRQPSTGNRAGGGGQPPCCIPTHGTCRACLPPPPPPHPPTWCAYNVTRYRAQRSMLRRWRGAAVALNNVSAIAARTWRGDNSAPRSRIYLAYPSAANLDAASWFGAAAAKQRAAKDA